MRGVVFGVVVSMALTSPSHAERFTNAVTGISIDKPDNWHVLTAEANAENLTKVENGTPEFRAYLQRFASVPLFAFTRFPEPFADVNPSVKLNTRPAGNFAGQPGELVLQALLPMLRNVMGDVKVLTAPEATTLSGRPAGHMKLAYTLKASGAEYPAISEMWVVPRGEFIVIIGSGYRSNPKFGDEGEVNRVVKSIQFSN